MLVHNDNDVLLLNDDNNDHNLDDDGEEDDARFSYSSSTALRCWWLWLIDAVNGELPPIVPCVGDSDKVCSLYKVFLCAVPCT